MMLRDFDEVMSGGMDVDDDRNVTEVYDEGDHRVSLVAKNPRKTAENRMLYYKKYISVPRVLKRDIRRQYPAMISNILNNADFKLFHSFFRTFSVGSNNIRLRVKDTHGVPFETRDQNSNLFKRDSPETFAYQGYSWIFFHWYLMSTLNPDQIVQVEDTKIITRSDTSESKVTMDLSVHFHRLFDIHITRFMGSIFGALVNEIGKPVTTPVQQGSIDNAEARNIDKNDALVEYALEELVNPPDPFDFYARKAGNHMPLLPEPQPCIMRMRFTFHLNEQKRIELLESSHFRVQ